MEAEFKDITAISGLGGLFRVDAHRSNGIIATSLDTGETKFISNRKNMFSMLETITMYTDSDNIDLWDVMEKMKTGEAENPPVSANVSTDELKSYFEKVVPDYDRDRVYTSDIKKLMKWYYTLDEKGIIAAEIERRKEATTEDVEEESAKEETPASEDKAAE